MKMKRRRKEESSCSVAPRVGTSLVVAKVQLKETWSLPLASALSSGLMSGLLPPAVCHVMSCHCIALDVEGRCYTWGRQLGHGDRIQRDRPTVVSELFKRGRSHTVVVTDDGNSLGWNNRISMSSLVQVPQKMVEVESSPICCLVSQVTNLASGAEFTVWLSSAEGASVLTAGLPQYGQLGHGTDNEIDLLFSMDVCMRPTCLQYNAKDSSVRLVYEAQPRPRAIAYFFWGNYCQSCIWDKPYRWGFGGYGRLGHREQKDEWAPRSVEVFQKHNVLPPNAVVSGGSVNSACTAGGGQLYVWGKIKNTSDDWMYPKPVMDLSGWNLRCMDSGNMHHFVGADSSCISWGHAQSSAVPKKVGILEGMHVISVACGMGDSMVVVDRTNVGTSAINVYPVENLDIHDGKGSGEETNVPDTETSAPKQNKKGASKTPTSSKKRKKANDPSDTEEEEENSDDESNSSEERINGAASGKSRGKGTKKSA
ncbi:Regulator of chromosome condensation family protein isoform 2 [Hibiscus syriacus]|uniref:Regulator of chromosome condensation family protein isoform 2 n=1 Tax=Hibiscus syriacus TaxID=106335 RepID=A0A6A3ATE2_HIBSY|nr:Regulator of chromosome condensation family protein isoform 2 [Hibiscus syriacus]